MVLFRRRGRTPLALLLSLLLTAPCLAREEALKDDAGIVVPTIDLSSWLTRKESISSPPESIVEQVRNACETVGFFQILLPQDHLLEQSTQNAWKATETFFQLPLQQKLRYKTSNETEYPYGFENVERLAQGKALDHSLGESELTYDTKETFAMGPSNPASGMPARRWLNDTDPELKSALETYYHDMEWLALQLLQVFAAAALQQPLDFFQRKMTHHMSALRLVNSYALNATSLSEDENNEGVIRAGAHTDYGALTILTTRAPGLQVFVDGQWHAVPYVPNAYIVNLGDLMQRWTNDAWHSTLHRVVLPSTKQRYSMAYFVSVNGDALIESLQRNDDDSNNNHNKYSPIRAGDHLMQKHLASMMSTRTTDDNDAATANVYSREEL